MFYLFLPYLSFHVPKSSPKQKECSQGLVPRGHEKKINLKKKKKRSAFETATRIPVWIKTFTFPVSTFLSYHTLQSRLQRLRLEAKSSTSSLFRKFMKIQQAGPGLLHQKAQPLRFFSHHPKFFCSLLGLGWNHYAGKGRDTKKSHILAPSVKEQGVCAL